MIRSTTPTFKIKLNTDISRLEKVLISFSQDDVLLDKTLEDCTIISGDTIKLTLTQEETNKFKANENAKIQIRVLTEEGAAFASHVYFTSVSDVLNDEVI